MDPFERLVEAFVPADTQTFDRRLVIDLMRLAWEQSRNATLVAVIDGKKENPPSC